MRRLLLILLLGLYSQIQAQKPPTCMGPAAPVADCGAACIHCNLDGYSSKTNRNNTGGTAPVGYCTFIVHHIEYVGFVAGSQNLSIEVTVPNCTSGSSIELGIYGKDCGDLQLVSNCNTAMFPGVHVFNNTEPLCIGCPYYLVIDGNAPADCNFSVRVLGGTTVAPPVTFNGPIIGPDHVCEGDELQYTVNHNGACYKMWTVTGATLVGPADEDDATVFFGTPGVARLCFKGENLCNPEAEICKDVVVHPNPIEVYMGPFEICDDEFYIFDGRPYKEGFHQIDYQTIYGCDSTVFLEIIEIETYRENLRVAVCAPDCYKKGGIEYCAPGSYPLIIQSNVAPFCDSVFQINLNVVDVRLNIEKSGDLTCGDTVVTLSAKKSIISGIGRVEYTWYDQFFDDIGTRDTLDVKEPGRYCLEVKVETPEDVECIKELCIEVLAITENPELAVDSALAFCLNDSICVDSLPIAEINGLVGRITIHSGVPDDNNRITGKIALTDTLNLYARFEAGLCEDVLAFQISILPTPEILVRDTLKFCEGDTVDLMSIAVVENNPIGMLTFHDQSPTNIGNRINGQVVLMQGDRIFVRSSIDQCFDEAEVPLFELPVPDPTFSIDRDTICLGDSVNISFLGDLDPSLGYRWSWNGAAFRDLDDENYRVTWSDTGWQSISLIVDNGICESLPEEHRVLVEMPLEPLVLMCEQNDSTILFTWNDVDGATNYQIDILINNGTNTRTSDTTLFFDNLQNGDVVRIRVTAFGPESCGPVTSEIECKAKFCPPREIEIDTVDFICLTPNSPSIDLIAKIQSGSGNEQFLWSGVGITDQDLGTFDPNVAGLGRHLITVVFSEQDCDYRTTTIIEVRPTPTASFVMDSVICVDTSASIRYTGSSTSMASAMWNYDGGFAFPSQGLSDKTISWSNAGMKIVELMITDNGCASGTIQRSIQVDPVLEPLIVDCSKTPTSVTFSFRPIANASAYSFQILSGHSGNRQSDTSFVISGLMPGEEVEILIIAISDNSCGDFEIILKCSAKECDPLEFDMIREYEFCDNDLPTNFMLSATLPGSLGLGQIQWTGPGLINADGLVDLMSLGAGNHVYVVDYNEEGCFYLDTAVIIIHEAPIADAGIGDKLTCRDSVLTIGNPTANTSIDWSYSWSPTPLTINGTGLTADVDQPGIYTLVVEDNQTGCMASAQVEITIETNVPVALNVDIQNVGCDSTRDLGGFEVLSVNGGIAPYEYSFDQGPYGSNNSISGLVAGFYSVSIRDANGCTLDTTIEIKNTTPITLDLGPDQEIYAGGTAIIRGMTNRSFEIIQWMPDDDLSCTDCLITSISPDSTVTLRAIVTDADGCTSIDEITIFVKYKNIFIPNAFSPNGDGINDLFQIFANEEVVSIDHLRIFDRWGELVFFAQDQDPDSPALRWDGRFKDEDAPNGVYVVHATVTFKDESTQSFAVDLTIIR